LLGLGEIHDESEKGNGQEFLPDNRTSGKFIRIRGVVGIALGNINQLATLGFNAADPVRGRHFGLSDFAESYHVAYLIIFGGPNDHNAANVDRRLHRTRQHCQYAVIARYGQQRRDQQDGQRIELRRLKQLSKLRAVIQIDRY